MEDMTVKASGYDFSAVHAALRRYVDRNILAASPTPCSAGAIWSMWAAPDWADREQGIALGVDHLFRVFSNTKLVTSCAALLLFEEGRFGLDEPIQRYIPQLANRRVL